MLRLPPRPAPACPEARPRSPASAVAAGWLAQRAAAAAHPCTLGMGDPRQDPGPDPDPDGTTAAAAAAAAAATAPEPQQPGHRPGAAAPQPAGAAAAPRHRPAWLPLVTISCLPHVWADAWPAPHRPPRRLLLLLDTGAGGAQLILNARGAEELGLGGAANRGGGGGGASPGAPATVVTSLGGASLRYRSGALPRLRVGGAVFTDVRLDWAEAGGGGGGDGGLDLSAYSHGMLAGGLLGRCTLLFDYARGRVALVGPEQ